MTEQPGIPRATEPTVARSDRSIAAYDLPDRIRSYDADMEVMHPNRAKMVAVALDVLPFDTAAPLRALDLGIGTGYFTEQFLRRFSNADVWGIDGAPAMIELAQVRLRDLARRVHLITGDFRHLARHIGSTLPFDVVYSSFALHHLGPAEKTDVARQALGLLVPGGWFVNADIVVADSPEVEARIQHLRVDGIVRRAGGGDPRFSSVASTRAFLDDVEARDGDQPQRLDRDLAILRDAGYRHAATLWQEYREVVCAALK